MGITCFREAFLIQARLERKEKREATAYFPGLRLYRYRKAQILCPYVGLCTNVRACRVTELYEKYPGLLGGKDVIIAN